MQQLSMELEFSLDYFMSDNFEIHQEINVVNIKNTTVIEERIAVPSLKVDKFKNVLLYILEKCAGKPNVGEAVLYKLLYFADFNYYELYEGHLNGAKYKKLPYGPVPQILNTIINQMVERGLLKRVKTKYHGYPQTRYLPLEKANLEKLKASETAILDHVIQQMSGWYAATIRNYSHKDLPWLA